MKSLIYILIAALAPAIAYANSGDLMTQAVSIGRLGALKHDNQKPKGMYLEELTWVEAEKKLAELKIVVVPIGAQSKEHGKHLPLNNDWILAEYYAQRMVSSAPVLMAPTVSYGFYPAFVEYPGSVNIQHDTSKNMLMDIAESFARNTPGIKVFFLNTGISTLWPLEAARVELLEKGIVTDYMNYFDIIEQVKDVTEQAAGTHADEFETSMMLYISPEIVQMDLAEKDISAIEKKPGPFHRDKNRKDGLYSPTGAWGDPTLATREKGQTIIERHIPFVRDQILEFASDSYQPPAPRTKYIK